MSDEEFLARWSRLKQEAAAGHAAQSPKGQDGATRTVPPSVPAENSESPEVDLSDLPPIDTIGAATDITVFLRKGIPRELSRAALRRAWSTDPAIRDFIGLAENAWDFNDPTAMPGFGPLDQSPDQVEALVRRIVGGVTEVAESLSDASAVTANSKSSSLPEAISAPATNPSEQTTEAQQLTRATAAESGAGSAASQADFVADVDGEEKSLRRRTHGGALPR